jgi:hypothetical protein
MSGRQRERRVNCTEFRHSGDRLWAHPSPSPLALAVLRRVHAHGEALTLAALGVAFGDGWLAGSLRFS